MPEKKPTRIVIRWPSAAVAIAGFVCVAAVYVLVDDPATRNGIAAGAALVLAVVLAFMRRILGVAPVLALAIAIPAVGCSSPPTVLSALELARKIGCATLCPESAEEPSE